MTRISRRHLPGLNLFGLIGGILLLLAAAPDVLAQAKPQPLNPQPAAGAVQPGLLPVYYRNVPFDSVQETIRYGSKQGRGDAGKPIANVDATSNAGTLWEAGGKKLYGIRIDGLIRLPAGSTTFVARSNDGFRLTLGGATVLEDGDVHVERLTRPVTVTVAEAGWYPLQIWYFQKQGGATLQLLWQPPGGSAPVAVPAEAFGHL